MFYYFRFLSAWAEKFSAFVKSLSSKQKILLRWSCKQNTSSIYCIYSFFSYYFIFGLHFYILLTTSFCFCQGLKVDNAPNHQDILYRLKSKNYITNHIYRHSCNLIWPLSPILNRNQRTEKKERSLLNYFILGLLFSSQNNAISLN